MYMTATISRRAITTRPIVPANESNRDNQYSPAPVQKIKPTKKQIVHTPPELMICIVFIFIKIGGG